MRGRLDARDLYVNRDPVAWPFSPDSIWNTPIGANATYSAFYGTTTNTGGECVTPGISGNGIKLDGNGQPLPGVGIVSDLDENYVVHAAASDPLVTVYKQTGWSSGRCASTTLIANTWNGVTPWQIHFPANVVIPDASGGHLPNSSCAIVQPDGSMIHGNVAARCSPGGSFYVTPFWKFATVDPTVLAADASIYSTGIYGGHGGSGLSAYGGALMPGELLAGPPIHHALSMDINGAEYLYYDAGTGIGHTWPACSQDAQASSSSYYGGYHGHYPALRMGSLLAVPPSVTEGSLGLTLLSTKKIFHAMQDYGVYIVDDTGWSAVFLNIESTARAEFENHYGYGLDAGGLPGFHRYDPLYGELMSIYAQLQVISNNGPSSIGGGGIPRVTPAHAF